MNTSLPFFAYGIFRPGEIPFLSIKQYIDKIVKTTTNGSLVLRDGLVLLENSSDGEVEGYLLHFKNNMFEEAYKKINDLEPLDYYKWQTNETGTFNFLIGIKLNKGVSDFHNNTTWNDPFIEDGVSYLENLNLLENQESQLEFFNLFSFQMKYLFLWSIIERFCFFRYGFGKRPNQSVSSLANDLHFQEAINIYKPKPGRIIYSSRDINKIEIIENKYNTYVDYYYQIRSNIIHRGKAIEKDYKILKDAYEEMLKIYSHILIKTREECDATLLF
jgi:hypothetical protein